jgi:hypothetical protein
MKDTGEGIKDKFLERMLTAQYLSLSPLRQRSKEPDNRKSIIFCSDLEIAVGHGCRISSFILQPLSFQVRLFLRNALVVE